jgi:hypothetical protein
MPALVFSDQVRVWARWLVVLVIHSVASADMFGEQASYRRCFVTAACASKRGSDERGFYMPEMSNTIAMAKTVKTACA